MSQQGCMSVHTADVLQALQLPKTSPKLLSVRPDACHTTLAMHVRTITVKAVQDDISPPESNTCARPKMGMLHIGNTAHS
jgi:hypothetical protein